MPHRRGGTWRDRRCTGCRTNRNWVGSSGSWSPRRWCYWRGGWWGRSGRWWGGHLPSRRGCRRTGRPFCPRPGSYRFPIRRFRHRLQQLLDNLIYIHPLRIRIEIGKYPMAKHRKRHVSDVLRRHGISAMEDGSGLGPQDQILGSPRTGPPGQPLFDKIRTWGLFGTGRPHQIHRIVDHVLTGRHLTHQLLNPQNVLPC